MLLREYLLCRVDWNPARSGDRRVAAETLRVAPEYVWRSASIDLLPPGRDIRGTTWRVNAPLLNFHVEEAPGLGVRHPLWTPLYVREPLTLDPTGRATRWGPRRLLRAALRMRADYVAVAEARGREVRCVFEAAALGPGSLATIHTGGLAELERRLRLLGVAEDLLDLLWAAVFMARVPGAGRRVTEAHVRHEGQWHVLARYDPDTGTITVDPGGESLLKARIRGALRGVDLDPALARLEAELAATPAPPAAP